MSDNKKPESLTKDRFYEFKVKVFDCGTFPNGFTRNEALRILNRLISCGKEKACETLESFYDWDDPELDVCSYVVIRIK